MLCFPPRRHVLLLFIVLTLRGGSSLLMYAFQDIPVYDHDDSRNFAEIDAPSTMAVSPKMRCVGQSFQYRALSGRLPPIIGHGSEHTACQACTTYTEICMYMNRNRQSPKQSFERLQRILFSWPFEILESNGKKLAQAVHRWPPS